MARSHGLKAKTLRRMLKKKGMKTTGKKATLMKRLHMRGGDGEPTHKVILKDGKYIIVDATTQFPVPDETITGNGAGFASFAAAKKAFDDAKVPNATLSTDEPVSVSDAATSGTSGAATSMQEEGGRRRRRRSRRRREEGGRRHRHSRRGKEERLGY